MKPQIRQLFTDWKTKSDTHIVGLERWQYDQMREVLEKAFRAGFEKGRWFEKCNMAAGRTGTTETGIETKVDTDLPPGVAVIKQDGRTIGAIVNIGQPPAVGTEAKEGKP